MIQIRANVVGKDLNIYIHKEDLFNNHILFLKDISTDMLLKCAEKEKNHYGISQDGQISPFHWIFREITY